MAALVVGPQGWRHCFLLLVPSEIFFCEIFGFGNILSFCLTIFFVGDDMIFLFDLFVSNVGGGGAGTVGIVRALVFAFVIDETLAKVMLIFDIGFMLLLNING